MSSLASDAAISGAKAAQTQQAYGNSEGGGHYGPSVTKPEKYESVDTPTPPPEGNSTAVSSNNGSSAMAKHKMEKWKSRRKRKAEEEK